MAKRALIDHRPWLLASLLAATAYYFLSDNPIAEGTWGILLKGAGAGLLAVYAWRRTRGLDGAILTLALALSSAADMVLEINFVAGGALFFAAHGTAVVLYWRNRKPAPGAGPLAAAALLIVTPAVSWLLSGRADVAVYSAALGAMAAAAFVSRFPLPRIGTGAVLFIVSDWLLFSRMGVLDLAPLPDLLVWPTYFAAQVMIASGVVQTLRAGRCST